MNYHLTTEIRKEQIFEAVQKIIQTQGSEFITVRNIAKEVKITEAAIYRHFNNKKDILSYLSKNIFDLFIIDLETILIDENKLSYDLNSLLKKMLNPIGNRKGMAFLVLAEILSLGDKDLYRDIYYSISKYTKKIEEILILFKKKGILKLKVSIESSALLFFSIINGVVNNWILQNYNFDLQEKIIQLSSCIFIPGE